ncbi:hypothetical protein P3T26_001394 [Streptomyces sp. MAA16]|nr:hypothetical protein [Streptomyces sp. MAA16]
MHHPLGFALQRCAVRRIGRFSPDDPLGAPWSVVDHGAARRDIEDPWVDDDEDEDEDDSVGPE